MSAVVYVHNDEASVGAFLRTVMAVLQEHFEHSEIICVNDHSQDSSVEIIRRISRQADSTTVTLLNMSYFHGVETAHTPSAWSRSWRAMPSRRRCAP